jgi:hypothetical protein
LTRNVDDKNVRVMALILFALVVMVFAEMTSCLTEEDASDLMRFAEASLKLWKYDRVIVFRNVNASNNYKIAN